MSLNESVYCVAIAFTMTERVERQICIRFCIYMNIPPRKLFGWSECFQGRCNECSAHKSVAQTLQRWLRTCWKWPTFRKTCNQQNPWDCWTSRGCNQRRSVTDRARTRRWCGDSKHYCVQGLDAGSWREMCCGEIRSVASATRAEGTSSCNC